MDMDNNKLEFVEWCDEQSVKDIIAVAEAAALDYLLLSEENKEKTKEMAWSQK